MVSGVNTKECIRQFNSMKEEVLEIMDEEVSFPAPNILGKFSLHLKKLGKPNQNIIFKWI